MSCFTHLTTEKFAHGNEFRAFFTSLCSSSRTDRILHEAAAAPRSSCPQSLHQRAFRDKWRAGLELVERQ